MRIDCLVGLVAVTGVVDSNHWNKSYMYMVLARSWFISVEPFTFFRSWSINMTTDPERAHKNTVYSVLTLLPGGLQRTVHLSMHRNKSAWWKSIKVKKEAKLSWRLTHNTPFNNIYIYIFYFRNWICTFTHAIFLKPSNLLQKYSNHGNTLQYVQLITLVNASWTNNEQNILNKIFKSRLILKGCS